MRASFLIAMGLAAAFGGASGLAAAPAANGASRRDWASTIVVTPEGGHRVGNPNAATKLVEYGSLTCSHCAAFATEGLPKLLQGPVRSGQLSFEFRHFVLNGFDLTASLLARCAAPANYFAVTDAMFAAQPRWLGRFTALTPAQSGEIQALPEAERPWRIAKLGGLDALAATGGVAPARAKACLADKAAIERLVAIRRAAAATYGVAGTPTFVINGKKAEGAHDWATLAPLLRPPGS